MNFLELAAEVAKAGLDWISLLVVAISLVPITGLVTLLARSSRFAVAGYRVLLGCTTIWILALMTAAPAPLRPSVDNVMQDWGFSLYFFSLVLAAAAEVVPSRKERHPQYERAFR